MKNQYIGVKLTKRGRGAWTDFRFKRGFDKQEGVDVFEVRLRPQYTI